MRLLLALSVLLSVLLMVTSVESRRVPLEGGLDLFKPAGWSYGTINSDQLHTITIALRQTNFEALHSILEKVSMPSSPQYGRYMSQEEVNAFVRPSELTIESVTRWLEENKIDYTLLDSWFVEATAPVSTIESLLQTKFSKFVHASGVQMTRSITGYSVPAELEDHIEFVGGVVRFPVIKSSLKPIKLQRDVESLPQVTPQFIREMYNITTPPVESSNLQAVVSFLGQYFDPQDLTDMQQALSLPENPIEKVLGPNIVSQPGVEASLDVQYLLNIPSNIRTWVYSTSGEREGGNEPFLVWLSHLGDTKEVPYVFSISYQDIENTISPDFAQRVNMEFLKWSVQGHSFVTGSGDWGVGCKPEWGGCKAFNADFPSDSPYITSLGATRMQGGQEVGIGFSSGGFSNFFPQFKAQTEVVSKFLQTPNLPTNYFNQTGRAFPDIGCIGNDFAVWVSSRPEPVAGTSASTPTWASQISMFNSLRLSQGLPTMGFINPFIYQFQKLFLDITTGDTQAHGCCPTGFECQPGWDPYTGLGTPNWGLLADAAMSPGNFNFPPKRGD